jgi:hypothetical protein
MFIAALFTITKIWNQPRCSSTNEWISMVYIHSRVLLGHKEESNYVICRKMDGTRGHHVKQKKPD